MTQHRPNRLEYMGFPGFNRLVYLNRGRTEITIQMAIWDEHVPPPTPESRQLGRLHSTFRWTDVTRLGASLLFPPGLPAELDFQVDGTGHPFTATDENGQLRIQVVPLGESKHRIVFILPTPAGEMPQMDSIQAGRFAGWKLQFEGAHWSYRYFLNIAEPYAVGRAGQARHADRNEHGPIGPRAGRSKRTRPRPSTVPPHGDCAKATTQAAQFCNTLFDTCRGLASSPVSRDWCYDWQGVLVFCCIFSASP